LTFSEPIRPGPVDRHDALGRAPERSWLSGKLKLECGQENPNLEPTNRSYLLPDLIGRYIDAEAERLRISPSQFVTFAIGMLATEREMLGEGADGVIVHAEHGSESAQAGSLCLLGALGRLGDGVLTLTTCSAHLVITPDHFGTDPPDLQIV
jgi:hypothetical protein